MKFTHVGRLAVLRPSEAYNLPTLATRTATRDAIGHMSELDELWPSIWHANRPIAVAYGLGSDDFEDILSAFPVFAGKRPAFYADLQERVREWRREVDGAKVYAVAAAKPPLTAECSTHATKPNRQPRASTPFQQAAVLAWVAQKLSRGYRVSGFRLQKMLYLIEAAPKTGLFTEFRKQAAGPYDPALRCKGPEDIAVRQKRWLAASTDTRFEPAPNIEEALRYAARYIDAERAERVLEEFGAFKDETLERWTTVHLAAVELERRGELVTPETVAAYVQRVREWQPKLSREEFAPDRIGDALTGLRKLGMLLTQEGDVGS